MSKCFYIVRYFGANFLYLVPECWLLEKKDILPFFTLTYYEDNKDVILPVPVHAHILLLADVDTGPKAYGRSYTAAIKIKFGENALSRHLIYS